ncbi:MAG: PIG-L deacetylase family protein [Micromonosporaceae bacterium]
MSYPPSPPPMEGVRRALAVFAHPDDVDFGAAGTVARWTAEDIDVSYLLVTRGEAGGIDDAPRPEVAKIREAEQRAAAAAVGVTDVEFLHGYADGAVYCDHQLRRDITRAIRQKRPERVLTNSALPDWSQLSGPHHPDHVAVGQAVSAAVYPDARNLHAHPELLLNEKLEPWTVSEVWFSGGPNPDHHVDITDTFHQKIAALRRHASQLPDPDQVESQLREWLSHNAKAAGFGADRLAEGFSIVRSG